MSESMLNRLVEVEEKIDFFGRTFSDNDRVIKARIDAIERALFKSRWAFITMLFWGVVYPKKARALVDKQFETNQEEMDRRIAQQRAQKAKGLITPAKKNLEIVKA